MNIVFRLLGKVVVYDKSDVLHVDTTSRNVGRYEHLVCMLLESVEGLLSLGQSSVRVDFRRSRADISEVSGDVLCTVFSTRKDKNRSSRSCLTKDLYQKVELRVSVYDDDLLLDISR